MDSLKDNGTLTRQGMTKAVTSEMNGFGEK